MDSVQGQLNTTTHVSLREACNRVKKERVLECIRIASRLYTKPLTFRGMCPWS